MNFWNYLKNIFLVLIFLQLAPSLIENIKKQYGRYLEPQTKVGVVPVRGILYDSAHYIKQLNTFFKDQSIKAILVRMESPGSAAGTGQAIYNEITALKKIYKKPIITLVENTCASGGYYIASATDYIIAPGQAIVGSIGTQLPYLFQLRQFIEDHKINYIPIKAGTYKSVGDPFIDMTPEEQALLQGVVNDSYQQFTEDIATARKLNLANAPIWADGKIFSGRQALKLGLIDELGSAHTAIKVLKEKALIETEIEWVKVPQKTGLLKLFGGSQEDDSSSMFNSLVDSIANRLCSFVETRYMTPRA